jgi:GNAT superfamily N-acetyltransferase
MATTTAADFRIRDALLADRAVIAEFNARLALETENKVLDPAVLAQGVHTALTAPDRLRYWVAETAERVIAMAAMNREWSDWRNGWLWWLQSVYVHPDFRGRGVFRAIYAHIRAAALAEPDTIGLRLYVESRNIPAQKTYRAIGMRAGGYEVYEDLWIGRSPHEGE